MDIKEQEFSRMVRENKSTIYTVCYMFSNDADEVSDLFQETLINLWKGFESFRNESKLSTWIYRVAMNTCISADRKKRRQGSKVPLSMNINLYDDEDHETKQVRQLHERIQRLDLVDRALVMMWLEGMSYEEIADVVGISVKNVGVKLVRIKEKLKQR
ncbi:MAG: sigma-70 family RNA polymerase sigma factor [Bacteroidaceae bacterium]|nr:sigma-70 family RNA polymerase sigma factor [Bacteroidaceae bacterium]